MRKTLVVCLLLSACSTEVQIYQLNDAAVFCKDHGGVARMWSDFWMWHAQCVDGTRLYKAGELK